MIVLDANILVSAVLGQQTRRVLARAVDGGVALSVPEPQLVEAARVLIDKIGLSAEETAEALDAVTNSVRPLALEFYTGRESAARARLHLRASPIGPFWPQPSPPMAACGAMIAIFSGSAFPSGRRATSNLRSSRPLSQNARNTRAKTAA